MIFGGQHKHRMRRQDSIQRVRAWRNVLIGTNVLVLAGAIAYLPLKQAGLLDSWVAAPSPPPAPPAVAAASVAASHRDARDNPPSAAAGADSVPPPAPPASTLKKPDATPRALIDAASEAYREGSMASARRLIGEALETVVLDQERAEALNLLGRAHAADHRDTDAVAAHLLAIEAWPAAPESHILLADSLRRLGHAAAAAAFIVEGAQRCGSSPFFDFKLKLCRVERGETEDVANEIRAMITARELPAHLAFVQAVIMDRKGDREGARRLAESIRKQVPEPDWLLFVADPATPASWRQSDAPN